MEDRSFDFSELVEDVMSYAVMLVRESKDQLQRLKDRPDQISSDRLEALGAAAELIAPLESLLGGICSHPDQDAARLMLVELQLVLNLIVTNTALGLDNPLVAAAFLQANRRKTELARAARSEPTTAIDRAVSASAEAYITKHGTRPAPARAFALRIMTSVNKRLSADGHASVEIDAIRKRVGTLPKIGK